MIVDIERGFIAVGFQVRRIAIEGGVLTIVAADAIFEVEVFNENSVEPFMAAANGSKRGSAKMCLARGAITEGPSGGFCLYQGNRYGFSKASGKALRTPNNIFRFNTFPHNGSGGIQVVLVP